MYFLIFPLNTVLKFFFVGVCVCECMCVCVYVMRACLRALVYVGGRARSSPNSEVSEWSGKLETDLPTT